MVDKGALSAEISAELDLPAFEPSRGGTITRPFLDAVALALGVEGAGLTKVGLMQRMVEHVGQTWDASCSSDGTVSGGGGNITATALRRLLAGIRALDEHQEVSHSDSAVDSAWSGYYTEVADWLEVEGHLESESLEDERWRMFSAVAQRRGLSGFRDRLLTAYEGRCAVSGTAVSDVLEAACIVPHLGSRTYTTSNGLPLRSDLHVLFDLGLLGVDPTRREVVLAPQLRDSDIAELHGRPLIEPATARDRPTHSALLWRAENVGPLQAGD